MKVLSTEGLTKLIQLIKSTFIPASDTVSATTVTLADVATTGDYNDLINQPTIPTVNNATLTIQKNGTDVTTFTANSSTNATANITVPTTAADVSALPDSTKYGADLDLTGGTLQLLDQDGNALGNSVTVPDTSDFVQKTGDTMTGKLSVQYGQANINVSNSDVTLGTNPASTSYSAVQFTDSTNASDWKNTRLGVLESVVNTDGSTEMRVSAHKYLSGDSNQATIWVKETTGGTASCSFPNTNRVDGQWVYSSLTLENQVSYAVGTYSKNFDLSTYLPNDGKKYEVLLSAETSTGNSSGSYVYVRVQSDIITNDVTLLRTVTRTSSSATAGGSVIIPVGTGRKIVRSVQVGTSATGNSYLYIRGYRRIGDNS